MSDNLTALKQRKMKTTAKVERLHDRELNRTEKENGGRREKLIIFIANKMTATNAFRLVPGLELSNQNTV